MRPSKRELIVERALAAFSEGGFRALGVDALARSCEVSKTSIYNHFASKDELVEAALALSEARFETWLIREVEARAAAPREQIPAVFDVLGAWFRSGDFQGCAFQRAAAEYSDPEHPARRLAFRQRRAIRAHLETLARAADLTSPKALADQAAVIFEGCIAAARLGHLEDPAGAARAAVSRLIAAAMRGR